MHTKNDMYARFTFDRLAEFAGLQGECGRLERGLHLSSPEEAQVTTTLRTAAVGVRARQLVECCLAGRYHFAIICNNNLDNHTWVGGGWGAARDGEATKDGQENRGGEKQAGFRR